MLFVLTARWRVSSLSIALTGSSLAMAAALSPGSLSVPFATVGDGLAGVTVPVDMIKRYVPSLGKVAMDAPQSMVWKVFSDSYLMLRRQAIQASNASHSC